MRKLVLLMILLASVPALAAERPAAGHYTGGKYYKPVKGKAKVSKAETYAEKRERELAEIAEKNAKDRTTRDKQKPKPYIVPSGPPKMKGGTFTVGT